MAWLALVRVNPSDATFAEARSTPPFCLNLCRLSCFEFNFGDVNLAVSGEMVKLRESHNEIIDIRDFKGSKLK